MTILRVLSTIVLKKVSFSSHESKFSRRDQSTFERTLPKVVLLLGVISRVLITLDFLSMVCLAFGNVYI